MNQPITDTAFDGFVSRTLSSYILLLYIIAITSPVDKHAKLRNRASKTAFGFVISKKSVEWGWNLAKVATGSDADSTCKRPPEIINGKTECKDRSSNYSHII